MKKLTAFILALLLACTAIVGCEKDEPATGNKQETTQSGKKETTPVETKPPREDVIKDYDQDDSQQGFSIKGKSYYYKGNDVVFGEVYPSGEVLLLNVANETDTNYTATLNVTYLNESGEKIKTERQTFKQFSAGYQRYFLFRPGTAYDSYTCVISLEEYTDEIVADKISFKFDGFLERRYTIDELIQQGDYNRYPSLAVRFSCTELTHPQVDISRTFVLFDNSGEIYMIQKMGNIGNTSMIGDTVWPVYATTEKSLTWPEELTGEVNGIFIFDILE